MEKIWRFEDKELRFDISEAGCMNRLVEALAGLRTNLAAFRGEERAEVMLARHCGILQEFFDDIFGDGTGEMLCGNTLSAEVYSRAYMEFLNFVHEQVDCLTRMRQDAEKKYMARAATLGISAENRL